MIEFMVRKEKFEKKIKFKVYKLICILKNNRMEDKIMFKKKKRLQVLKRF